MAALVSNRGVSGIERMHARKIIAITLSLTALGLSNCQGNRLQGSTAHNPYAFSLPTVAAPTL
jgi:hypothetical protein